TSATTPIGSHALTITGTSGSLSHTAPVSLVVNAPAAFSLSAAPSSQTVVQGAATSYTATVPALNGFNVIVGFTVMGLPTAAAATFTPTSVPASASPRSSDLTSVTTPIGSRALTITGTSGSLSHAAPVTLVITAAPSPGTGLVAAYGFNE